MDFTNLDFLIKEIDSFIIKNMFSRFTEKAIQSIMLAQESAKKFQHSYVGTEHIILGIFDEGDNVVVKTLKELNVSTDQIKLAIEETLEYGGAGNEYTNIPFTQQAKQVLTYAWDEARKLGHNYVNVEHLFLSIFRDPTNVAARILTEHNVNVSVFKETLLKQLGNKVTTTKAAKQEVPTPTLDLYGRDLTLLAQEKSLDPIVGRKKEIDRIIQILSRRSKNNPVLTGEPGVGKTAIVEGLAQRICNRKVPDKLSNKRVITLDLGLLVAGTKYRGEFEDRVKKVMEEVRKADNIIIFVDELHTLIGTGGSEGSLDAANLFKPALARGELQCIGATTLDEYRKHIEDDGALERRFQSVLVEEPSKEDTVQILRGIKSRYEDFHNVTITDDALVEAVELATRYITDRFLPDKAVDVIDEAASKVMLMGSLIPDELKNCVVELEALTKEKESAKNNKDKDLVKVITQKETSLKKQLKDGGVSVRNVVDKVVDTHSISDIVSNWTGIPISKLTSEESKKLKKLGPQLVERIKGQEEAIDSLVRAVKRSKVGLKDPKRPTGSFLFLGPTGVGKSELAKTLAELLFGSEDHIVRIDMSEYMEKHTVSRLIGSPPGYVGFNEGGQLTEPVRRRPYSIVLFDELEKASPDITNILLQILEDGRLTDANGRIVNFKNTIIIMTSNVGGKYIVSESKFGFVDPDTQEDIQYKNIKDKLQKELKEAFKPEFLNRIDDVIVFKPLSKPILRKIVDVMLSDLIDRLKPSEIDLEIDSKVRDYIADKGYDPKNGARPLRRAIQEFVEDGLADKLIEQNLKKNIKVKVTLKKDKIDFSVSKIAKAKNKKIITCSD